MVDKETIILISVITALIIILVLLILKSLKKSYEIKYKILPSPTLPPITEPSLIDFTDESCKVNNDLVKKMIGSWRVKSCNDLKIQRICNVLKRLKNGYDCECNDIRSVAFLNCRPFKDYISNIIPKILSLTFEHYDDCEALYVSFEFDENKIKQCVQENLVPIYGKENEKILISMVNLELERRNFQEFDQKIYTIDKVGNDVDENYVMIKDEVGDKLFFEFEKDELISKDMPFSNWVRY